MKKSISFFFILILLLSLSSEISLLHASGAIMIERGSNYVIMDLGNGKCSWESQPQWVYNGIKYVPYIFIDRYMTDGYYQVQSGFIGARIYAYYAVFYTPDMKEVRLYDERWEVERWKTAGKGSWDVIGAQSGTPTFSISKDAFNINVTKSFSSWAGVLSIKYVFSEGQPLKHDVTWTSLIAVSTQFRVLQKWAGIIGSKVIYDKGVDTITSAKTIDSSWFGFLKADGSLSVLENQMDMYYDKADVKLTSKCLQPIVVDVHAQGMKADFAFGDWTLAKDQSLLIDPDTATLNDPTEDGNIRKYLADGTYLRVNTATNIDIKGVEAGYLFSSRGYVEWDVSSISDGATITNTVFKYNGQSNAIDCHIHAIAAKPSTATGADLYEDIGDGTVYADPVGFPVAGTNQQINLGSSANTDLKNLLASDWFAIGFQSDNEASNFRSYIYAEEYTSATPKPTLYVEYTTTKNIEKTVTGAITIGKTDTKQMGINRGSTGSLTIDKTSGFNKGLNYIISGALTIGKLSALTKGLSQTINAVIDLNSTASINLGKAFSVSVNLIFNSSVAKQFGRTFTSTALISFSYATSRLINMQEIISRNIDINALATKTTKAVAIFIEESRGNLFYPVIIILLLVSVFVLLSRRG